MQGIGESRLCQRLVESLYAEAMLLADEARSYFDEAGRAERERLDPLRRVTFSCESLKVTTRLMHAIAWLLTQRGVQAGEISRRDALDASRRLGEAPATTAEVMGSMPAGAQALIAASIELYRRVGRLDAAQTDQVPEPSPARAMFRRLERAF